MLTEEEMERHIGYVIGTHGNNLDLTKEQEYYFWEQLWEFGVDACDCCGVFWYLDDLYDGMCESCEEAENDS